MICDSHIPIENNPSIIQPPAKAAPWQVFWGQIGYCNASNGQARQACSSSQSTESKQEGKQPNVESKKQTTHHSYRGTFILRCTVFSWQDSLWISVTSAALLQPLGNVVLSTPSLSWDSLVCLMRFHWHLHFYFLLPDMHVRQQEGNETVDTAKSWLQDVCGLVFLLIVLVCFKRELWQEWWGLCRLYSATT